MVKISIKIYFMFEQLYSSWDSNFDEQDPPWINSKYEKALESIEFYNELKPNNLKETILNKLLCKWNKLDNANDTAKGRY